MPAAEVLSRFAQTHEHLTFGHVVAAVAVTVLRGKGEGTIYRVEIVQDYQPGRTRFIARYWEEREVSGQTALVVRNDLPWVDERDADAALSMALGFISDRHRG